MSEAAENAERKPCGPRSDVIHSTSSEPESRGKMLEITQYNP